MSSHFLQSVNKLCRESGAFPLWADMQHDDLYWFDAGANGEYIVTRDDYRAYGVDASFGCHPRPPPRARLAMIGRWASRDFHLLPDTGWCWEYEADGHLFGDGVGILVDDDPRGRQSHFKRGWDSLATLQDLVLPATMQPQVGGALETMWGEPCVRLHHTFIEVGSMGLSNLHSRY